uniref:Uncharacterized protein n=1 Tax=Lepeophtheirus salmonis TaxID=72036 RepID=A0A0K2VF00_LEPSM
MSNHHRSLIKNGKNTVVDIKTLFRFLNNFIALNQ